MTWTQTITSWPLPASPRALFGAFTDVGSLRRWFAEHAQVGDAVDGHFRFWGRHTLGAPAAEEATQRITAFVPGERLGFTWRVMGVDSTVDLAFAAEGEGAKITATHTFTSDLGVPRQRELVDDFWRLCFGNLSVYVANGAGILRPDFTDPRPEIKMSIVIEAPPAKVFRALMDPALVNEWTGSTKAAIDVDAGTYSFGWEYDHDGKKVVGGPTRIIEIVPDRKLVLDWPDWRGDASVTGQTISFTLTPEGRGTRVDFVHAGFTRAADISDYPFGWGHFLSELTRVAVAES
jgi:uncharacterized protein YndB with AHSA1/START domain